MFGAYPFGGGYYGQGPALTPEIVIGVIPRFITVHDMTLATPSVSALTHARPSVSAMSHRTPSVTDVTLDTDL